MDPLVGGLAVPVLRPHARHDVVRRLGEGNHVAVVELEEFGEVDWDVVEVFGDERDHDESATEPAREALVVDHRLVRDAESLGAEHAHERPAELLVPDRGYHRDHPAGVAEGGGGSGADSHPDDEDDGGEEEERGGDEGGAMPVHPGPGAPLEQRRVLRDHAFVRRCVGARHGE